MVIARTDSTAAPAPRTQFSGSEDHVPVSFCRRGMIMRLHRHQLGAEGDGDDEEMVDSGGDDRGYRRTGADRFECGGRRDGIVSGDVGSLAKASGRGAPTSITDVRAGRHACYDRLVVDLAPDTAGYGVEYVSSVVTQGKGDVLRLRGGAFLRNVVLAATDDVNTGASTYNPRNPNELAPVTGWHTFRQLAFGGSFEGYTTIGLGVRARLPFRVFALRNPGRLVIDVAHHW